jgi:hypothetical protein
MLTLDCQHTASTGDHVSGPMGTGANPAISCCCACTAALLLPLWLAPLFPLPPCPAVLEAAPVLLLPAPAAPDGCPPAVTAAAAAAAAWVSACSARKRCRSCSSCFDTGMRSAACTTQKTCTHTLQEGVTASGAHGENASKLPTCMQHLHPHRLMQHSATTPLYHALHNHVPWQTAAEPGRQCRCARLQHIP